MNTSNLTKGTAWKAAGKNLAGIIIGLVAANQIQKLNPTPINANLASGEPLVTGGVLKKKGQTDFILKTDLPLSKEKSTHKTP